MSNFESWSKVIEESENLRRTKQDELNRKMEEGMNEAIGKLKDHTKEHLLELMLLFHNPVYDHTETKLRMQFFEACKKEVLRRMVTIFHPNYLIPVGTKVRVKSGNSYRLPDRMLTVTESGKGYLYLDKKDLNQDSYKGPYAPQCFALWDEENAHA